MENKMRKMNKGLVTFMMMLVMFGCLVTGCGSSEHSSADVSSDYSQSEDYGFNDNYASAEYADESYNVQEESKESGEVASATADSASGSSTQSNSTTANSTQKIIKRYDYNYETEKFDEAYDYLKEQIEVYDGYVSSSDMTGSGSASSYRTLYLTARIPAEKSDAFISEMGSLGTVVRQSESAEDVTLQYSDTESRIESLKAEQESLNKLLEQADSLETIIALQDRLTEVRYELESYQSRKKLYDDLISYSTIDIKLEEVNYTVEVDDSTFFSRILTGLERSIRDIAEGLISFVEWFIIHLPYFLVWGIIIFIIVKVVRKMRKKSKEKKMKKQLAKQEALAQKAMEAQQGFVNVNNNLQDKTNQDVAINSNGGNATPQDSK